MGIRSLTSMMVLAVTMSATAVFSALPAASAWMPEKPIKIVIPFGAGGSTDTFGRVFANAMEAQTGWTIVVENRPGAGGAVGQIECINANPDGYTVCLSSTSLFAIQPFMPDTPEELTPDSVEYLGTLGAVPFAIVAKPDAPYNNLAELAEYTKANGPVRFAATNPQITLAMNQLSADLGFEFLPAQTSGSSESLQLVSGGHADITVSGGVHVAYVLDGRLKVLAHLTDERGAYASDKLTVEEQGGTLPHRNLWLFNVAKGVDPEVKDALAKAIDDTVNTQAVKDHAAKIHVSLRNLGPDGSTSVIMSEAEKWSKILSSN